MHRLKLKNFWKQSFTELLPTLLAYETGYNKIENKPTKFLKELYSQLKCIIITIKVLQGDEGCQLHKKIKLVAKIGSAFK